MNVCLLGLPRGPALYPFSASNYSYHPMLSPEMAQVAAASSWHTPYSGPGFRSPYPSSLPINAPLSRYANAKNYKQRIFLQIFYMRRFSPSLLPSVHPHHSSLLSSHSHPALVSSSGSKQDNSQETNHRYGR